ncbi:MAG: elongation factor Ts [Clostridia bacterium]|nr:elongation factor Ts [Clostridia bacterium]
MANISAKDVAALRAKTGCGMMECKKALVEAEGNMDEAIKVLRERGLQVAAKKADRIAAEGIVAIKEANGAAAMIEVNSESDFVAKNDKFQAFVGTLLDTILTNKPADVDALLGCTIAGGEATVDAALKEQIFVIGEKLTIRRFVIVEGAVSTYVHGGGNIGVIVKFDVEGVCPCNEAFKECAHNVALQCAAMNATYATKADVPASAIEEEKAIQLAQMANDPKLASKPDKVKEGIVMGKMGKFYEQVCLDEQAYVKDDSVKVGAYVASVAKEVGGKIAINSFVRYEKGEGLQKREDNLAEEVAKLAAGK